MPVQACRTGSKPGYKYGESGRCYTYTRGNENSRKRAKRKAFLQGAAVEASKSRSSGSKSYKVKEIEAEMREDEDLREFDDSINDWVDKVRKAFQKKFPEDSRLNPEGMYEWTWVSDVFEDYVVCRQGEQYYEVGFTEEDDGFTFDERESWTPVKLSYVAEMTAGSFRDLMFIYELKKNHPEVPILEDIDLKALTSNDADPKFVTLPVGMVNVRSANKRFYSEEFVKELESQIRSVKPVGLMGHLSKGQEATEFPSEAVHWVGVLREGDVLWGKGYLPPGESRDRILRYQATSKKIATSIYAKADGIWDSEKNAYDMIANTLELRQIDIAPADRAGIADLAAVPLITAEMVGEEVEDSESEEQDMGKDQVIQELTAEDAPSLPEAVKQAIRKESKIEADIRSALGVDEKTDVVKLITELRQQSIDRDKETVSRKIQELVSDPEKGVKLESVRGLVTELVKSRNPSTVQEAETAFSEIISSEAVTKVLATTVKETMGPSQRAPIPPQNSGKSGGKFFEIPKET